MKRSMGPALLALVVAIGHWHGLAAAAGANNAQPPKCQTGTDQLKKTALFDALQVALSGPQCSSVLRVLTELQNGKRSGGRKLKPGEQPDKAAAQKELTTARADAEFSAKLNAALGGVADPMARKAVEAAVLDDLGYFSARELLMSDLFDNAGAK